MGQIRIAGDPFEFRTEYRYTNLSAARILRSHAHWDRVFEYVSRKLLALSCSLLIPHIRNSDSLKMATGFNECNAEIRE
jgi:hypothetical protein